MEQADFVVTNEDNEIIVMCVGDKVMLKNGYSITYKEDDNPFMIQDLDGTLTLVSEGENHGRCI